MHLKNSNDRSRFRIKSEYLRRAEHALERAKHGADPDRLPPGVVCTPEEKTAGWNLLADGTTSKGWLEVTGRPLPTDSWTIEDGCLKAVPDPDGFQDIRTVGTYRPFELQFEWKILNGGNSGVKYLVQRTDSWRKDQKSINARARGPDALAE